MAKFCRHCGAALSSATAKFCRSCGKPLVTNQPYHTPSTNTSPKLSRKSFRMPKPLLFATVGAIGFLIGALLAEFLMPRSSPPTPVSDQSEVCLVLDCSSSMEANKLAEMKQAAKEFIKNQDYTNTRIGIVGFNNSVVVSSSPSKVVQYLEQQIDTMQAAGSTQMQLGLAEAWSYLESSQAKRIILLFTDGAPDPDAYVQALYNGQRYRSKGVNIVAVGTEDADFSFLKSLTGDSSLVFQGHVGALDQAFTKANNTIQSMINSGTQSSVMRGSWVDQLMLVILWIALISAIGSLALIIGQNIYLHKPFVTPSQGLRGLAGGLLAGGISGLFAQTFYSMSLFSMPDFVIRCIAWAVCGGLLGIGMAAFIPNLRSSRGLIGGLIGGIIGGGCFLGILLLLKGTDNTFSFIPGIPLVDTLGRLIGATIMGFFIGLMIALIEEYLRTAWLEVAYSTNEKRNVTLGNTPVIFGADRSKCTVYVKGLSAQAYCYTLRHDAVYVKDLSSGNEEKIEPGDCRCVGDVAVTVCAQAAKS